jgi:hypothetical protein
MTTIARLVLFAGPLFLLILTAIAGYSYSQIRFLNLPVPQVLALFTVVLPLIAFVSNQTIHALIRSSKAKTGSTTITLPIVLIIGFQLIYETIIATLAMTYVAPPSALECGLTTRWTKLYKARDTDAIRSIQDAFNCCGLKNVHSMAWPWGSPSNCAEAFERTQSCFAAWKQREQINGGLLFFIAISVFTFKALSLLSLLTNSPWGRPHWPHFHRNAIESIEAPEEDNRATMRRLIEDNANGEEYHDEEPPTRTLEAPRPEQPDNRGPIVQPSSLIDTENAWRDGEEHTN